MGDITEEIKRRVKARKEEPYRELDDLQDAIMRALPESCRHNSLGARDGLKRFVKEYDDLLTANHLLRHGHKDSDFISVLKLAYRKHHLGDDSIGWNELSDRLCDALCNAMGDAEFQKWLADISPQ